MLCGLLQENMATPEDVCRLESTWCVVAEMTSEPDSVIGKGRGGSGAVFLVRDGTVARVHHPRIGMMRQTAHFRPGTTCAADDLGS